MGVTHEFHRIAVDKIIIPENRQRAKVQRVEELAESIKRVGLFHPVILRRDHTLVTGACRLSAFRHLGAQDPGSPKWKLIPAIFTDELDQGALALMELEENIRRTDLTWQEQCLAVLSYVELRGPDYNLDSAPADLGMSRSTIYEWLQCGRALKSGDEKVAACETIGAARNFLKRKMARAVDDSMMLVLGKTTPDAPLVLDLDLDTPGVPAQAKGVIQPPTFVPPPVPQDIKDMVAKREKDAEAAVDSTVSVVDFLNLAPRYDGPRFNLIHCDFPYGIGHDKSEQARSKVQGTYEDSEETFWNLLDCLLDNRERLVAGSAHIMFWFPMKNYTRLVAAFSGVGWAVNPVPLIWHKSDNIGIVPDPKRRPRQVYETALLITVGDRPLVAPYPNCVSMSSGKRSLADGHTSRKQSPMLQEHFKGLVDESTRLLDPTCGGGSALGAAIMCGAKSVTGWEINEETAQQASLMVFHSKLSKMARREYEEDEDFELLDKGEVGPTDEELQAIENGDEEPFSDEEEVEDIDLELELDL